MRFETPAIHVGKRSDKALWVDPVVGDIVEG